VQEWFGLLEAWHDFYVFAGTAAATLMGLMFVVVSLGQRNLATERGTQATRALFTPIVAFFSSDIVISMLMLSPQTPPAALSILMLLLGVGGIVYMVLSGAHRLWRDSDLGYDDLMWYVVLPYICYAGVVASAVGIWKMAPFGLYCIAATVLLFLVIGIRNAWDLVIFSVQRGESQDG
jgi:hypothetical protein